MHKISQSEACNWLCAHRSAMGWVHKREKNADGAYTWLTPAHHENVIKGFKMQYLKTETWRIGTPISRGVRFDTGSELDIHGTKCYAGTIFDGVTQMWYSIIVVECDFCTNYYVLDTTFDV